MLLVKQPRIPGTLPAIVLLYATAMSRKLKNMECIRLWYVLYTASYVFDDNISPQ